MTEMPSELNLYSDLALVGLWDNLVLYMPYPLIIVPVTVLSAL